jgi:hypothetical protein
MYIRYPPVQKVVLDVPPSFQSSSSLQKMKEEMEASATVSLVYPTHPYAAIRERHVADLKRAVPFSVAANAYKNAMSSELDGKASCDPKGMSCHQHERMREREREREVR